LATRTTKTIGILVREATEQYFPLHLQAISTAARNRGYRISVGLTASDPKIVQDYLDNFANGQVDGSLISTADVSTEQVIELTDQGIILGTPLRYIPGYEYLCGAEMDMQTAFRRILQYLYSMEHRQFGFICGKPAESPERYEGMHQFIHEMGLEFPITRQLTNIESFEESQAGVARLLKKHPEITAIACSNDVLAVGAMMGAHDMGYNIPGDLSVTGFDDVPVSRFCIPRLTTVRIPIEELATISVNNLIDRIEGKAPAPPVRLPLEILIRESTGTPRKVK
jgi:DNA-binding LacI/PurR family transcriptional regulator